MSGVEMQGHAVFFSEIAQNGLFIGRCRVFTERPDAAIGVAADEVVRVKFDYGGRNHVEKILNADIFLDNGRRFDFA